MALSRYHPEKQSQDFLQDASSFYRGSSIFGFDKADCHQKGLSMASRDWFAPAKPVIRLGDNAGRKRGSAGSFFGEGRTGIGAHGAGPKSPLQQQFQTSPTIAKTVDGFEIVSVGYYQNEGHWNQGGPQYR